MEAERNVVISGAVVVLLAVNNLLETNKVKRKRRWWSTKLYEKRVGNDLLRDLKFHEVSGQYKNFTRMSPSSFEELLKKIGPKIQKKNTNMREAISVQDRLAVTLRFLATGDSYSSLQYLFRISKQVISSIVPEVCAVLVEVLKDNVKLPADISEWMKICNVFENVWNLPHCVGSIDGKHVVLQAPMKSGSEFINYHSKFSIVLFALVDANYNFLFADIGCQGRISDGGVFSDTELYRKMKNNALGLPPPIELPTRHVKIPYFFAADSAFALGDNIMKPYAGDHARGSPKRIFNYRLSRARRVVENVFGIISAVFRVLRKPMLLEPEKAQLIVAAIVYLHNYLRRHSPNTYTPPGTFDGEMNGKFTPGSWRDNQEITSMLQIQRKPRRSAASVEVIRDELADYCSKEGALEWQNNYA